MTGDEVAEIQKEEKQTAEINRTVGFYLIAALAVLIAIGAAAFFVHPSNLLLRTVIYVGVSGGIGGVLYCIRGFIYHNIKNDFDPKWKWWYMYQPVVGFVFGILAYFLIVGGLLSLGTVSNVDYTKGTLLYCAISFLAGFASKKFNEKLDELATTIFSVSADSAASTTPAANFVVSGFPNPVAANSPGSVTVTAKDAKGNTVNSYNGTVKITSTNKDAQLPDDHKFQTEDKGVYKFNATLKTVGTQSIIATDAGTNSITGSQTNIIVNAPAAASPVISSSPNLGTTNIPGQQQITATETVTNQTAGSQTEITAKQT